MEFYFHKRQTGVLWSVSIIIWIFLIFKVFVEVFSKYIKKDKKKSNKFFVGK